MKFTSEFIEVVSKSLRAECLNIFGSNWNKDVADRLAEAALEAVFDHIPDATKMVETEDNQDEWIKWDGGQPPTENSIVEIKLRSGATSSKLISSSVNWMGVTGGNLNIVAYRVISEPKEEKPKEQTLLEFMNQFSGNINLNTPEEIIVMISDYLEQLKQGM